MSRRVAAIVLPWLACEIAGVRDEGPSVVVLVASADEKVGPTSLVEQPNDAARRQGVRAGQTVAEACARVAGVAVRAVARDALVAALGAVAEIALAFGPRAAVDLDGPGDPADTAWLDLTGCAHLAGGEEAVAAALAARVAAIGHRARVAIADGPRLARAVAMHGAKTVAVVPAGQGKRWIAPLPVAALPIDRAAVVWLARLGIFQVEDLAAQPPAAASARLGERAPVALALAAGRDDAPLRAWEPPRIPREEASWDDGVGATSPLLFAARGLVARIAARLEGRGEATRALEVALACDASIAALRGAATEASFRIDFPAPLAREADLFRALKARLDRVTLAAPVKRLTIVAAQPTRAPRVQLDLGRDVSVSPDALPVLLAELSAEVGAERVGVLEAVATHRPEAQSRLVPVVKVADAPPRGSGRAGRQVPLPLAWLAWPVPTRLLPSPISVEAPLAPGALVPIDRHLFTVERIARLGRLDRVEWWTDAPVSRDYARVTLATGKTRVDAWIYVDRVTGDVRVQGFDD